MVETFRIKVQFPGFKPYWVDVRLTPAGYRLALPGERWRNLEFAGGWNKDGRVEMWAPEGSHFTVRGDWYWLDYYDAARRETYGVPVLEVDEPDPDPELEEGYRRAMDLDAEYRC